MSHPAARRAVIALLGAAFLYGATFVVIKAALDSIEPLAFVAWRFTIGAIALGLFALPKGRSIWRDGSITGLALFAGYALQTAGLAATTASNSALITGLYVVFTPLLAAFFRRRPPSPWVVTAAAGAFVGIFLLTDTQGVALSQGDLLTLGCAVAFALHIIALARFAGRHPVVPFTTVQLAVTASLAFPLTLLIDGPGIPQLSVWPALLVTALGVSVGAFLLQVWAQTVIGPGTTAVILAAEPAFAVATAWVVLSERLDAAGWAGTALIVVAIYLVVARQHDDTLETALEIKDGSGQLRSSS
jgi:drug/metabolite transporter (DMT)-like permease